MKSGERQEELRPKPSQGSDSPQTPHVTSATQKANPQLLLGFNLLGIEHARP
jgi:hypothetical protein